jgi:hypothetical protein
MQAKTATTLPVLAADVKNLASTTCQLVTNDKLFIGVRLFIELSPENTGQCGREVLTWKNAGYPMQE